MAVWNVSTAEKKSVEEHELWTKDGVEIRRLNGFRWGSWTVTTSDDDEPQFERYAVPGGSPDEDSIDMYNCYDNNIEEVELISLDDGWYGDWIFPDDFDEDEKERIIEGWEEDSYEFMENEGWYQSDGECWVWGELTIESEDGDDDVDSEGGEE